MHYKNTDQEKNKDRIFEKILFWNVDTQYDFMRDDNIFKGALPVVGARAIEENLEKLTAMAERYELKVVNTADWHTPNDAEISVNPDYKKTYPQHCMARSKGAEYIHATNPKNPYILSSNTDMIATEVSSHRNIVLHKDDFDVFVGNKHTNNVLDIINPEKIFVYGVATNVCVNFAVQGLLDKMKSEKKNYEIYVVQDAVKELPNEQAAIPLERILDSWNDNGVKMIKTDDVHKLIRHIHYQSIIYDLMDAQKSR
ncbi:MAG: cysteine hydrolase family protein [Candidatus Woesearchaeota archaeon]